MDEQLDKLLAGVTEWAQKCRAEGRAGQKLKIRHVLNEHTERPSSMFVITAERVVGVCESDR